MSTSMLLFSVLNCEAEYNYFNRELISITNKLEANTAKLEKQTKYEEQYNKAYDDALDPDKKISGVKDEGVVLSECQAAEYAHSKVRAYDENLLEELNDLDLSYSTRKTSLETQIEMIKGNKDTYKQQLGTSVQDTHLLNN